MQKAARVICVSEATRHELLMHGLVDPQRIRVVHNAIDPDFSSGPNPEADQELARLLGPPVEGVTELLHVGSTARRKRLDVLLQVAVNLQRKGELVRLIRVGPEVPRELHREACFLADRGAFVSVSFLSRAVLAALYRRAALLLQTSDAEGFGLPVAEAVACGLTAVASDIAVLREVGGSAAYYCPPGDVAAWTKAVEGLIQQHRRQPSSFKAQHLQTNLEQASRFSLEHHLSDTIRVYEEVTGSAWPPAMAERPQRQAVTVAT